MPHVRDHRDLQVRQHHRAATFSGGRALRLRPCHRNLLNLNFTAKLNALHSESGWNKGLTKDSPARGRRRPAGDFKLRLTQEDQPASESWAQLADFVRFNATERAVLCSLV